jgi:hypothetical protein
MWEIRRYGNGGVASIHRARQRQAARRSLLTQWPREQTRSRVGDYHADQIAAAKQRSGKSGYANIDVGANDEHRASQKRHQSRWQKANDAARAPEYDTGHAGTDQKGSHWIRPRISLSTGDSTLQATMAARLSPAARNDCLFRRRSYAATARHDRLSLRDGERWPAALQFGAPLPGAVLKAPGLSRELACCSARRRRLKQQVPGPFRFAWPPEANFRGYFRHATAEGAQQCLPPWCSGFEEPSERHLQTPTFDAYPSRRRQLPWWLIYP